MSLNFSRELTPMEAAAVTQAHLAAKLGMKVIHPGGRQSTEHLFDLAQFEQDQHVLEIGCGVGTTAIQIADRFGCQVTAVDINPEMVQRAKSNIEAAGVANRVTIEEGDMLELKYPDESFDRVVIEAVTQFVDRPKALAEIARVCKAGAFVIDHEAVFPEKPPPEVIKIMQESPLPDTHVDNVEGWEKHYTDAGFEEIRHVIGDEIKLGPAAMMHDQGLFSMLKILGNVITSKEYRNTIKGINHALHSLHPYVRPMVLRAKKPA